MAVKNNNTVLIGTRGSKLALVQAKQIRDQLLEVHGQEGLEVNLEVISTAGDRSQKANIALSEIGGKGLFTEEIEARLLDGTIDFAVHSTKDMPTVLPDGLELACFPEREAPEDAFVSKKYKTFNDLPKGATVGSASLRRQAIMLHHRPDLNVIMFRGNVDTRLRKVNEGEADATLLALSGLRRLGLEKEARCALPVDQFLPAPGQGAICVEVASDNQRAIELLKPLNHRNTEICVSAERAYLAELDGSCRTPIAGLARIADGGLYMHGMILSPDGRYSHEASLSGSTDDPLGLGRSLGKELRDRAGERFFDSW